MAHGINNEIERRLVAAQPRLLRLAQALGVPAESRDDMVQEALIAAWRQHDDLRDPDRFDAWLDAICRNQCRMELRRRYRAATRFVSSDWDTMRNGSAALPDPLADDPLAELDAEEMVSFIARALEYLSPTARAVLEARHLAGLSERESAARLGISVGALQARLHRARQQLRAVFADALRVDAESLGLVPDGTPPIGWRETRIWCNVCGRRRLLGAFERLPSGRMELRLCCPDCSLRYGRDIYRSKGLAPLEGVQSFGPALTRTMRALVDHTARTLATGRDTCLHCGAPVQRRVVGPGALPPEIDDGRHWVIAACGTPGCSGLGAWTAAEPAFWFHPTARAFMAAHPRWIKMPESVMEIGSVRAIRFGLADPVGTARLTLLAHPRTLEILRSD